MTEVHSLCVYCGSSGASRPAHRESAERLGTILADHGVQLIYGGGHIGLMGVLADAVLAGGGRVIGVLPRFLVEWEVEHRGLTEILIVESMHERKQKMFELADAFVILPGGLGTLDEALEILTWKQLGLHEKPLVVFGPGGFWTPLRRLFDHLIAEGYAQPRTLDLMTFIDRIEDLLPTLAAAPEPRKGRIGGRI